MQRIYYPAAMTQGDLNWVESQVGELIQQWIPESKVIRIRAIVGVDPEDEPRLLVIVVLKNRPTRDDISKQHRVVEQLQVRLLEKFGDDRLPFVNFVAKRDYEERLRLIREARRSH